MFSMLLKKIWSREDKRLRNAAYDRINQARGSQWRAHAHESPSDPKKMSYKPTETDLLLCLWLWSKTGLCAGFLWLVCVTCCEPGNCWLTVARMFCYFAPLEMTWVHAWVCKNLDAVTSQTKSNGINRKTRPCTPNFTTPRPVVYHLF